MSEKGKETKADSKKENSENESIENESEENEEKELEEIIQEEDYYENMSLNQFLANPWKQVSLDERGFLPITNLEEGLPTITKKDKDYEQENIEYTLFKNIENEQYQTMETAGNMLNEHFGEEERKLDQLKRMYEDPRRLSAEFKPASSNEIKYITSEDTKRTNYLIKKQFGDN